MKFFRQKSVTLSLHTYLAYQFLGWANVHWISLVSDHLKDYNNELKHNDPKSPTAPFTLGELLTGENGRDSSNA